jgi:hypothetical protein
MTEREKALELSAMALPPAVWQPPPEGERPDGYSCLVRIEFAGTEFFIQMWWYANEGGLWHDAYGYKFDDSECRAFAPLPEVTP